MQKEVELGTLRIRVKDNTVVEKTKTGWKKSKTKLANTLHAIELYAKNKEIIIDQKNPQFYKGMLSKKGQPKGARITLLPNKEPLGKAFSLFAENLTFHDQDSHDHWDVLYKNKGGTFAYVYTKQKELEHKKRKYKKVDDFAKHVDKLEKSVKQTIKKEADMASLALLTMLKTQMRIGSETYFQKNGHKGLTTLKKKDITVSGNKVTFKFIAKDGVPVTRTQTFSPTYITRLQAQLAKRKKDEFVFVHEKTAHPLTEHHFKQAFKRHCGKEYYPHIIRSFYATQQVKDFVKNKRKASKEEVRELFTRIAHDLGHRKFDKKTNEWKESYNVTIGHYIQPELVERAKKLYEK